MCNVQFESPVAVRCGESGRVRVVHDTLGAAEMLLRRWPSDRHGDDYLRAVQACVAAMEGAASGGDAGEAFRKAVASAGANP